MNSPRTYLRPRVSTLVAVGIALLLAVLMCASLLLADPSSSGDRTVVTIRLWDEKVADAYRASFEEFGRSHPDIEVRTNVVAYSSYFDTLRTDVAGGGADDLFWLSNAYFAGYADTGRLLDVTRILGPDAAAAWDPSVVAQFSRGGILWGVPQLTDGGIAVYYNADLLDEATVDPRELADLRWRPGGDAGDTLLPLLRRLTVDAEGDRAGTAGFDPDRIRQWGYNAANDLQGIYLNFVGSAGGVFSDGDRFAFDGPASVRAFTYVVDLINGEHVAPPASDTNGNGDFSRNQFLAGRMALFQSGTYNLAAVADGARFRWGVAMLPSGPAGRVSVTNGISVAANSATRHPDAVREVLGWLGSARGNRYLGAGGAAVPAVTAAQPVYFRYWADRGVDTSAFFRVLDGPRIPAPGGAGFAAGFQALTPYFDEMFLGRRPVAGTLAEAQTAANDASGR